MKRIVFPIFAILLAYYNAYSQCAMCRATLENNVSNGEAGIATGINFGILYLFIVPYLLIAVVGIMWYRRSLKSRKTMAG